MPRRGVAVVTGRVLTGGRGEVWCQARVPRGGGVVTVARVMNVVSARHWGGVTGGLGIHVGHRGHRSRGRHTVGQHRRGRHIAAGRLGQGCGVCDRCLSPGDCVAGGWCPGLGGRDGAVMTTWVVDGDGRHPGHRGAGDQGDAGEGGRGDGPGGRGGWSAVHFTFLLGVPHVILSEMNAFFILTLI